MLKQQYIFGIAALLALAATLLVYFPGLYGPFVFDDMTNILLAPHLRMTELTIESLQQAWNAREFDALLGRPIAMLSFAFNYYFTQFDAFYFKLTNLVIHLCNGIALYFLTVLLLRRHKQMNKNVPYKDKHLPWIALAIAGAWLLHPLNLTAVLYVVQRMTSLFSLFIVLGLIGYCIGRSQIVRGNKLGFITISVSFAAFGLLSVLSKENGVMLLPFAAIIELVFYRFSADKKLSKPFRWSWIVAMAVPAVLALSLVLFQSDKWFGATAYQQRDFTLVERVLTQARVLWLYLQFIFVPDISKMSLYHDNFALSRGLLEPASTLLSILGIAGLAWVAWIVRHRTPILSFAIAWFFVGHSLESSVVPLEMIHEHRNYLPQYGVLFAVIYFVAANYKHKDVRRTFGFRIGFLALFGALLAIGTYARSLQWQDEQTLFTREVMNNPGSARAHTMLGVWLHERGQYQPAREHLAIAGDLMPDHADPLIRLVQNIYVADKTVPKDMFDELRLRLTQKRVSDVTLWVYEPLLRVTRDNAKFHREIVDLYEAVILRSDIHFGAMWYEAAYERLAQNYAFDGRTRKALEYYGKARAINQRPRFDIESAKLYALHGCGTKATDLISSVRARWPTLESAEENDIRDVETLLKTRKNRASRCTL